MVAQWRVRKYMHTLDRLALVVREEREALGLSVRTLADDAQVTPRFIERIESGHADADLDGVWRVLDALGIKPLVLPPELVHGHGA